ncbi:hypothetical protein ACHAQH_003640 [Verticillium albo-atrum]
MLQVGRILDHAVLEIDKALYSARKENAQHKHAHGRCGCEWQQKVENSREHADNLEVAVEYFEDLWRGWKRYLRSLEKRGDRRVGGLEEWRRRDGRGHEREESEILNGFYNRDMRVDEMDALRQKQKAREAEKLQERYLAQERERQWADQRERERRHHKTKGYHDSSHQGFKHGSSYYENPDARGSREHYSKYDGSRSKPRKRSWVWN